MNNYSQLPYTGSDMTEGDVNEIVRSAINEAVSGVFRYKGKVAAVDDLPANASVGDVYWVGATDQTECPEYYWNGTLWDYMGMTANVDLTNYYTKRAICGATHLRPNRNTTGRRT